MSILSVVAGVVWGHYAGVHDYRAIMWVYPQSIGVCPQSGAVIWVYPQGYPQSGAIIGIPSEYMT